MSITLPIHLISDDNESDQEHIGIDQTDEPSTARVPVRQYSLYVTGFEGGSSGVQAHGQKPGEAAARAHCRLVHDVRSADVIIIPEGGVSAADLAVLAAQARPDAEIIQLNKSRLSPDIFRGADRWSSQRRLLSPTIASRASRAHFARVR